MYFIFKILVILILSLALGIFLEATFLIGSVISGFITTGAIALGIIYVLIVDIWAHRKS
jgi:hypothetical protein